MKTVHHATVKRATAHGLRFELDIDTFTIVDIATGIEIVEGEEEDDYREKLDEAIATRDEVVAERKAEEEEEEQRRTLSKCIRPYREKYAAHQDSCGDDLHWAIKAFIETTDDQGRPAISLAALQQIAVENGVEYRWHHLNPGQQRMCLGNVLRARLNNGKAVFVNGVRHQIAVAEKAAA